MDVRLKDRINSCIDLSRSVSVPLDMRENNFKKSEAQRNLLRRHSVALALVVAWLHKNI